MADLVPAEEIEQIVGARRHPYQHLGRACTEAEFIEGTHLMRAAETVYILRSEKCRTSGIDLRECEWSLALDRGIDLDDWNGYQDQPVVLAFRRSRLFPVTPDWLNPLPSPGGHEQGEEAER